MRTRELRFGCPAPKNAVKNVEAVALIASRVCDQGLKLPVLESIGERVTVLGPALGETSR